MKSRGVETVLPLEEGKEVVVGASAECEACVDDEFVSSKHFCATLKEGKLEVKDVGSTNGLYLKVQEQECGVGSSLLAGNTIFSFEQRGGDD